MGVYIDIALSLIFIYLVLSLVVSAVNELISMWLRKRPAMLAKSILSLIDDGGLRGAFYKAGALVNPGRAAHGADQASWTGPAAAGLGWQWSYLLRNQTGGHPSFIDGATFARALTVGVLKKTAEGQMPSQYVFTDVEAAVKALEGKAQIYEVLQGALSNSRGTLEGFEAELKAWYDRSQNRLTGEYARWAKSLTLVMGALLVIFTNTDTVRIAGELRVNEAARTALVERALGAVDPESGMAINVNCRPKDAEEGEQLDEVQRMAATETCLRGQVKLFDAIGPKIIGWDGDPLAVALADPLKWTSAGHVGNKLLGLLITICAISLGAPFWFDVLSKVVNIRAAGPKPAESRAPNE